jgi:citrate synthase
MKQHAALLPLAHTPTTTAPHTPWASGLEDVVAAATRLSDVDGAGGRLWIAGRSLDDLDAANVDFINVAQTLLAAATVDGVSDRAVIERYRRARAAEATAFSSSSPAWLGCSDAMQALAASLCLADSNSDAAMLIGRVHATVASWQRHRRGMPLRAPRATEHELSAGAWVLALANDDHDAAAGAALDRYFAVVCDHGLNASTFVARVVASTGATMAQAVVAAVTALAGPLHGGAPGPVLDLFDAFARDGVAALQRTLNDGERLMGFGHRVYRTRDPRAAVLERVVRALLAEAPQQRRQRLDNAADLEREALALLRARHPTRPLEANVEFFTAVLLEAIGIERDAFTAVFACGRVAGWCAHVVEQRRIGKLIRPRSIGVG